MWRLSSQPVSTAKSPPIQETQNGLRMRDNNVLIATTVHASKDKKEMLTKWGIPILTFESKNIPLGEFLFSLRNKEIISILVEGGGNVLGSFFDENLIDKAYVFHAPILIGGEKSVIALGGTGVRSISEATRLKSVTRQTFDDNVLTIGYPYKC